MPTKNTPFRIIPSLIGLVPSFKETPDALHRNFLLLHRPPQINPLSPPCCSPDMILCCCSPCNPSPYLCTFVCILSHRMLCHPEWVQQNLAVKDGNS